VSVTTRTEAYHHGDLRAALIRSALELLERVGPEQVSLRGLAEAAGVSRSAPYNHFRDKRELLAAVAEVGFGRFAQEMLEGDSAGRNARERFLDVGRGYARFALNNPNLFKLMFSAELASLKALGQLQAASDETQSIFRTALDAFLEERGGAAPASMQLQTLAWGCIHGLSLLLIENRLSVPPRDPHQLVAQVTELFTDMVTSSFEKTEQLPPR